MSVKVSLRTMQRIIFAFRKDRKVPFSQRGLIPDSEKLRMKVQSRKKVSYSWQDAVKIAEHIRTMDGLGKDRREQLQFRQGWRMQERRCVQNGAPGGLRG
jgi:hypothetical protein